MTANQINFAKLQEDIRHNKTTEGETSRHNVEDERIRSDTNAVSRETLAESLRHNVQTEAINAEHYGRMDAETSRSNLARETETNRTNLAQEQERERSNRATETIKAGELEETTRHNKKVESETKRHNKAEEKIGKSQATSAQSQARTAAMNAETRYQEYLTTKYRTESEARYRSASVIVQQNEFNEMQRHNQTVEMETNRHNKESEMNEWNRNQNTFVSLVPGTSQSNLNRSITAAEKAKATESLARAGYLKSQDDWYAWNQIVHTATDVSQAVKNFSGAIPVVGMLTK